MKTCAIPRCGREIRLDQFLCQTHWRMVPHQLKGKVFIARERAKSGHGKTALKAVEVEAKRAVRAALAAAKAKGGVS